MKMSSSNIPILVMGVTAKENYPGLRHIVQKQIADPLKAVPGVAEVMVIGGPEREIHVRVDPRRLEATGIPLDQIVQVLEAENLDMPAGKVRIGWSDYTVRVPGRLRLRAELGRIVVGQDWGSPIHLRDIAEVEDSFAEAWMEARRRPLDRRDLLRVQAVRCELGHGLEGRDSRGSKMVKRDLPPDVQLFTFCEHVGLHRAGRPEPEPGRRTTAPCSSF